MPNKDGTGPEGKGANSGRKYGNCNSNHSSKENNFFGRRFGLGKKRINQRKKS